MHARQELMGRSPRRTSSATPRRCWPMPTRPGGPDGDVGAVGFCMSGGLAVSVARAFPDRVAAAASIHGAWLVRDTDDSPHRGSTCQRRAVLRLVRQRRHRPAGDDPGDARGARAAGVRYTLDFIDYADHGFAPPGASATTARRQSCTGSASTPFFAATSDLPGVVVVRRSTVLRSPALSPGGETQVVSIFRSASFQREPPCTERCAPLRRSPPGCQPTPWRRRPTMISTSPLDTARRATSSCPGSPLAPVSGIGPGTVVVGPAVGAAEVADSSPAAAAARRRAAAVGCRRSRRFLARSRSRRRRRYLRTFRRLWQRDGERRFRRAHPRPTSRKFHRRGAPCGG